MTLAQINELKYCIKEVESLAALACVQTDNQNVDWNLTAECLTNVRDSAASALIKIELRVRDNF